MPFPVLLCARPHEKCECDWNLRQSVLFSLIFDSLEIFCSNKPILIQAPFFFFLFSSSCSLLLALLHFSIHIFINLPQQQRHERQPASAMLTIYFSHLALLIWHELGGANEKAVCARKSGSDFNLFTKQISSGVWRFGGVVNCRIMRGFFE
jgi:hypothetical protein